jgi:hypothetical protein
MSNLKKIVAVAMALSVFAVVAPASAQTVEELQAQINALLAQLSSLQAQVGTTTTTSSYTGCTITSVDTDLTVGSTGDAVKCLQVILNADSATQVASSGVGSAGNESTYFGSMTQAAVIKFQDKYASEVLTPVGLTSGTGYVGAKTRAKLNAMLAAAATTSTGTGTGTGTTVTSNYDALTVSLDASNPDSANIQKNTANNVVAVINLTGSDTEDVTVTAIAITQYGNTADNKVSAVRLFDESNVQIGNDRKFVGGIANFVLVPALTVKAGETRTISVAVTLATDAETLTTVKAGIASADDITGAEFEGSYPLIANTFTVVPSGTLGALTVGDYSQPSDTSVEIGQKDVVLESFIVSAGSKEAVTINQITVKDSGTIADGDLTNIRIKTIGGSAVTEGKNLSNNKITFNLTDPVTLAKGTSQKFQVIGDIV